MEWIKRAIGLKIFLLVWLLVALIPLWRLKAQRQWTNPRIYDMFMLIGGWENHALGLQNENESEMGKLFPQDSAAQLIALGEPHGLTAQNSGPYFQNIAALSRRFPQDSTIRASWLRSVMRYQLPIESRDLVAYQVKHGTNVNVIGGQPKVAVLPVAIQKEALQAAHEGAVRQPDNSFWPWMEVCLNYSLQRDEAALEALKRAGNCTRFDDGTATLVSKRIEFMRRVQTTDTFDDYYEMWSLLLPHYARLRGATRETMWQANLALKRGDRKKALQIAELVQKAAVPLVRSNEYFLTRLIGEALCYIAWADSFTYAGIKRPPDGTTATGQAASRRKTVEIFAHYARQNGRPDFAESATKLQSHFIGAKFNEEFNPIWTDDKFDGVPQSADILARNYWLGAWLLQFSLWGSVAWLVCFALSRWKYIVPRPQQSAAVISSAFCVGIAAAILWGLIRLGAAHDNFVQETPLYNTSMPLVEPDITAPVILICLWLLVNLLCLLATVRWTRPRIDWKGVSRLQIALYLGLGVSVVTCIQALWNNDLSDTIWGRIWPAPLVLFWASLLGTSVFHFLRVKGPTRWPTLFFWAAVIGLNCGAGLSFVPWDGAFYFTIFALLSLVLLAIALITRLIQNVRDYKTAAPFVGDLVARTRIASATLVMAATIGYLALNLVAIPTSHHAQSLIDEQLRLGEVKFIQKRTAGTWLTIMTNAAY